jgi:hypothetical protein
VVRLSFPSHGEAIHEIPPHHPTTEQAPNCARGSITIRISYHLKMTPPIIKSDAPDKQ